MVRFPLRRAASRAWRAWQDRPSASTGPPDDEIEQRLEASQATLRRVLEENILPFWYPRALDEAGGYDIGTKQKRAVTQARMVWLFSHLHRSPYGEPGHLDAARHGYAFLRDCLWDQEHGGVHWEVGPDGKPTMPEKHLIAQDYAMFALAEHSLATGDEEPADLGRRLFELLERHAHDDRHGGYREAFTADWQPLTERRPELVAAAPWHKTVNGHLHMVDALRAHHQRHPDPIVRQRLSEQLAILTVTTLDRSAMANVDDHDCDWSPTPGSRHSISYGHELERISLTAGAAAELAQPLSLYRGLYEELFAGAYERGWDRRRGGFFLHGPPGRRALNRAKVWWVQAEALLPALLLHRLTGDPRYGRCYLSTLEWITTHQADWDGGEWFERVLPDGSTEGAKSGPWKAGYHNGRAMLDCLAFLSEPRSTWPAGGGR